MPDVSLSVTVTRTHLSLPVLQLEDPGVYRVMDDTLGPGSFSWRKQTVESPYVHGRTVVNAVKDVQIAPLGVLVYGSTQALLHTRMGALARAFEQWDYTMTVTIDGTVVGQWTCEAADYAVGGDGAFAGKSMLSKVQPMTFQIPRHPVPLQGAM